MRSPALAFPFVTTEKPPAGTIRDFAQGPGLRLRYQALSACTQGILQRLAAGRQQQRERGAGRRADAERVQPDLAADDL